MSESISKLPPQVQQRLLRLQQLQQTLQGVLTQKQQQLLLKDNLQAKVLKMLVLKNIMELVKFYHHTMTFVSMEKQLHLFMNH